MSSDDEGTAPERVSVIRSEERLRVGTVRVASERVRIRRVVVTEERTVTVQVRREELVIEREPLDGPLEGGGEPPEPLTFVLHAEVPVVTTRVVPVERVSVVVDRITAMRTVSEEVRAERVDVAQDPLGGDPE